MDNARPCNKVIGVTDFELGTLWSRLWIFAHLGLQTFRRDAFCLETVSP